MGLNVITGATGHLGNVLVRELLARGAPVRVVVQPGDDLEPLQGLEVERVEADVRDASALRGAFRDARRVFHLAGLVCITAGQEARMEAVNVGGPRAVLDACRAAHVERLIYMGSVHALTEPPGGVLDETAGFDPALAAGPYARTKAAASRLVQAAARAGDVDAVLVLPTGVVGPFDFRTSEMGQLLLDLEAGRVPFVPPGGHDFVDVRDVAVGTLAAADAGRCGEAYLLGGERLTLLDVARVVAAQTGRPTPTVLPTPLVRAVAAFAPAWERATGRRALLTPYAVHALSVPFTVSHEKARRELGFAPRPVATALRDALAWHHARGGPRRKVGPGRVQLGSVTC